MASCSAWLRGCRLLTISVAVQVAIIAVTLISMASGSKVVKFEIG
jgi:hypothetical protein